MGFRIQDFKVTAFVASVFAGFAASVVGAQPRSVVTAEDAEIRKILGERIGVQGNDIGIIVGIIEPQGRRIISSGHRSANASKLILPKQSPASFTRSFRQRRNPQLNSRQRRTS